MAKIKSASSVITGTPLADETDKIPGTKPEAKPGAISDTGNAAISNNMPTQNTWENVSAETKGETAQAVKDVSTTYDKAETGVEQNYQGQLDTDGQVVNPVQHQQIALEGRNGNYNNMSGEDTIANARAVDAYNAKPVQQVFLNSDMEKGSAGSGQEAINKRELSTVESRYSEFNMQVDNLMKRLDAELQAAINAKDFDAYKKKWELMNGITMTKAEQELAMLYFEHKETIQNVMAKDQRLYNELVAIFHDRDTANFVVQNASSNPLLASVYAYINGIVSPSQTQAIEQGMMNSGMQKYLAQGYDNYSALVHTMADLSSQARDAANYYGVRLDQSVTSDNDTTFKEHNK